MKYFNLKDIIQNQANKEANIEWAKTPSPEIPKFIPPKADKKKISWGLLLAFRP